MCCGVTVLGTDWDQKDACQMGAGVGGKVRITGQKSVLGTTHGLPSVGKLSAGTGHCGHLPFGTNFLTRFTLELYPCPSGYFYYRKTEEHFPENMFPN